MKTKDAARSWMVVGTGPFRDVVETGPGCGTDECDCGPDGHVTWTVAENCRPSDAHLIAAAPDLLEAAKILADLDSIGYNPAALAANGSGYPKAIAMLRAAIAKATNAERESA